MLTPRKKPETVEQKKEKNKNTLFTFLSNINYDKKDLMREEPDCIKEYNPFIINLGLSFGTDTIMYANEMNREVVLDPIMHHDYLVHSIRKKKRFNKWLKSPKEDSIEIVQKHYKYSREQALQALSILTEEDIKQLEKMYDEGGV